MKVGIAHDHEEPNWLRDHRPPAMRDGTGGGPDNAFDAAARAAEDKSRL
jgi:hypothetical protein